MYTAPGMKKFIITFDYLGCIFSAKVIVKKLAGKTSISTLIKANESEFLLDGTMVIFMQQKKGFQLFLLKSGRRFEILNWNIQLQIVDDSHLLRQPYFSLS